MHYFMFKCIAVNFHCHSSGLSMWITKHAGQIWPDNSLGWVWNGNFSCDYQS